MARIVVRDVEEYGKVELAKKYPSTAGSQPEVPVEEVDRCMEAVERDGYVVIQNLISPDLVAEPALTASNRAPYYYTPRGDGFVLLEPEH